MISRFLPTRLRRFLGVKVTTRPPAYQLLDQPGSLAPLLHALERVDEVALDTEADNMYHYKTRVCLLQFLVEDEVFLVDVLAPGLKLEPLWKILAKKHLVMHGSSSVPQDILAEIRSYGGDMKETYGVPVEEIQEGIRHGVRKVNIDTDIRLAMTAAIRKFFAENPSKFDPREYLKPAMLAAKQICKQRYEQFGAAGMAGKIKAEPLDAIATRYRSGELAQVVN